MIKDFLDHLKRGVLTENPILILALGLCPALAVSTSLQNGVGMGLASTFVLVCSNVIVSLVKNIIPPQVRIPSYIVIIATFVTIVQLLLKAYLPELDRQLGLFIPLIVVNCIILGRAEAFASKNDILSSALDGVTMGLGFTAGLALISIVREVLGSNKLWGLNFIPGYQPMSIFVLAPGGFFTIAFVIAVINYIKGKREEK